MRKKSLSKFSLSQFYAKSKQCKLSVLQSAASAWVKKEKKMASKYHQIFLLGKFNYYGNAMNKVFSLLLLNPVLVTDRRIF